MSCAQVLDTLHLIHTMVQKSTCFYSPLYREQRQSRILPQVASPLLIFCPDDGVCTFCPLSLELPAAAAVLSQLYVIFSSQYPPPHEQRCHLWDMLLVPVFGVPVSHTGWERMYEWREDGSSGMPGLPVPGSPAL